MSGFNSVTPSLKMKKKKMKWVPKILSKEQKEKKNEAKFASQSQHQRCLFCKKVASKHSLEDLLLEAVFNDQADKINSLIQAGADPNARRGAMGDTALHFAVMMNKKKAVVALVEGKANVNIQHAPLVKVPLYLWRGTPLHSAASAGSKEVVEILLSAGARVDSQDAIGETPLHNAIHQSLNGSHEEVIQALLNAGADPTAKNHTGLTPIALAYGDGEREIGNLLTSWQKAKLGSKASSQIFSQSMLPAAKMSKYPHSSSSAIMSLLSGDRKSVSIDNQSGSFSSSFSSPLFGAARSSPFLSKPPAPTAQSKNGKKNKKKRKKQKEKQRNKALSFS